VQSTEYFTVTLQENFQNIKAIFSDCFWLESILQEKFLYFYQKFSNESFSLLTRGTLICPTPLEVGPVRP